MGRTKIVGICVVVLFLCNLLVGEAAEEMKRKAVNINTATAEELVKNLPMMPPEISQNIIRYRDDNGAFLLKQEILQVPGMNRTLLKKIEKLIILDDKGNKARSC